MKTSLIVTLFIGAAFCAVLESAIKEEVIGKGIYEALLEVNEEAL